MLSYHLASLLKQHPDSKEDVTEAVMLSRSSLERCFILERTAVMPTLDL